MGIDLIFASLCSPIISPLNLDLSNFKVDSIGPSINKMTKTLKAIVLCKQINTIDIWKS